MDELKAFGRYVTMIQTTSNGHDTAASMLLAMLSRIHPSLASNGTCEEMIASIAPTSSEADMSWLEQASKLIHNYSDAAYRFEGLPTQKTLLVIHKVLCQEQDRASSSLRVISQIYKVRYVSDQRVFRPSLNRMLFIQTHLGEDEVSFAIRNFRLCQYRIGGPHSAVFRPGIVVPKPCLHHESSGIALC